MEMRSEIAHRQSFALGMAVLTGLLVGLGSFAVTSLLANRDEVTKKVSLPASLPLEVDPFSNWTRPEGPVRIALQAGHWKNEEVPDEQENLKWNGAHVAGLWEWKVNLAIAERTKSLLEAEGYEVEILPTTIPPDYWADVFIAIHADENKNRVVRGYKAASSIRDRSGQAARLNAVMEKEFGRVTGMPRDSIVSDEMRGYYAFNWRKYEHALHPMTAAIVLETGYLTNARDRRVVASNPSLVARGIAAGIKAFLAGETAEKLPQFDQDP